jgi:hypothetical protein
MIVKWGSVVAKQVYGPLRPRDLDRADRRSSKGPDMTCSKERLLHSRYHVSFVPRVRHERVVCSEWREEVVALAAAYWSGFDMHRRLRETDRSMVPSTLARCLSQHGRSQTDVSHVAGYRSPMARVEKKIGHVRADICSHGADKGATNSGSSSRRRSCVAGCPTQQRSRRLGGALVTTETETRRKEAQVEQALGSPWP